jgi:hypothetical protein
MNYDHTMGNSNIIPKSVCGPFKSLPGLFSWKLCYLKLDSHCKRKKKPEHGHPNSLMPVLLWPYNGLNQTEQEGRASQFHTVTDHSQSRHSTQTMRSPHQYWSRDSKARTTAVLLPADISWHPRCIGSLRGHRPRHMRILEVRNFTGFKSNSLKKEFAL